MKVVKGVAGSARMLGFFKSAYANTTHGFTSIKPVSKAEISATHDHHSGMEQIETVYDKFKEMIEEYHSFFRSEQELENAFRHVEGSDSAYIDSLIEFLADYNNAMDTLMELDKHFKTEYHLIIKSLVDSYGEDLAAIHIRIEPDGILRYVKSKLYKAYGLDPHLFDFLIHDPSLTKLLIRKFRSVKAIVLDESDDKILSDDMHGVVIDRKC